jgi:hypothetical protein
LIISHQSFTWKPTPSPVLDLLDTSQKTKAWFRWFRIWSFDFSWSQKFGLIPWGPCGPNKPNPDFFMTDIFSGLCICQCSGKVRSWGCYGNIMAISFFWGMSMTFNGTMDWFLRRIEISEYRWSLEYGFT